MSTPPASNLVTRLLEAAESVIEDERQKCFDPNWWTAPYRRLDTAAKELRNTPETTCYASFSNEQVSDDAIRSIWRAAGGEFHGPNIETGHMPESKLLPFLRSLGAAKATDSSLVVRICTAYEQGFGQAGRKLDNPYKLLTPESEAWNAGYQEGLSRKGPALDAAGLPVKTSSDAN